MSTTGTATTTTATTATTPAAAASVGVLPLLGNDPRPDPVPPASALAALKSQYDPAARAFLHCNFVLAQELIDDAFLTLRPPTSPPPPPPPDPLHAQRCKWDILRITLESFVFEDPDRFELPPALSRRARTTSPQESVTAAYRRSLVLFSPATGTSSSACLPQSVLVTLMASSLKARCPAVGRRIVEDWLADGFLRDPDPSEAHPQIFELYCLRILPELGEWDFANEFLQGVAGLTNEKRAELRTTLQILREQARAKQPARPPASSLRPPSPAPSASSSSSSLSTLSTRTITPLSCPGPSKRSRGSTASIASDVTVKRRPPRALPPRAAGPSPSTSLVRNVRAGTSLAGQPKPPSTLALAKESFCRYLVANRSAMLSVLFLLLPLLSYLLRARRGNGSVPGSTTTDQVKRRLVGNGSDSFLRRVWGEIVRAIVDTVRMGGSGLV